MLSCTASKRFSLGPFGGLQGSHFGASQGVRSASGAHVGAEGSDVHSRAPLLCSFAAANEPSQAPLWPFWGGLGGLVDRFRASEARKGEKAKHMEKTNENQ
mgnify:CR=1 FL=1